ncbi:MAG TPA: helix-turn-helix transcriptional regulator [Paludibacter sp.]
MYNLLNIKEIASKKNISIKSLIVQIGISEPGFYKSLENNSMNIKTLAKIAEVMQVSISELISDSAESLTSYELKKNEVVESPVTIYAPPEEKEELKQIMYEQQIEIATLLKEKVDWMEKAHSLELELERVKNAFAPGKDAIAG